MQPLPGDRSRKRNGTPTENRGGRGPGPIWRAVVSAELLSGPPLARRVVAVTEHLRSLDRPITQTELGTRAGCHRATVGRLALAWLGGIIERSRRTPGRAWWWRPDPDLSASDAPRRPRGYVPLAALDVIYAGLLRLEPLGAVEAAAAVARSVAARYDGRLRPGWTIEGLARDAGVSVRRYLAAERRLVALGYLTRTGARGRWSRRLAHPDGPLGVVLRRWWRYETRRWARRARPAVCGRLGALRRWSPIGSRARRQRPLYTQCEREAKSKSGRSESDRAQLWESVAASATKERAPPERRVEASDLNNVEDPDQRRWQVLSTRPDWAGPTVDVVVELARLAGPVVARASALEVDHRIRVGRHPVGSRARLMAGIAWCYSGRRCRWQGQHVCGQAALVADRARRCDEQADRWHQARAEWFEQPPERCEQADDGQLDGGGDHPDDGWDELVGYLVETGQTTPEAYDLWSVPAEYRQTAEIGVCASVQDG